jgi:hypothetical protein
MRRQPSFGLTELRKVEGTTMKIRRSATTLVGMSMLLLGASGSARAADQWFVLGEQALRSADPSAEIASQGNRWEKDIKQTRLSVEGADVEISKVVLKWDNRRDQTITDIGVLKSGGQSAPRDAPGFKGRLTSVAVQYRIIGGAPTANLKVWGFD